MWTNNKAEFFTVTVTGSENGMLCIEGQRSKKLHFVAVQQANAATVIFWF